MELIMPVKIFYPFIFLLIIIIELSESIDDSNLKKFLTNNPPVTHYYPEILLKLNKSGYEYTEKDKIMVEKIFNHTKSCEEYEDYLFNEKSMLTDDRFDGNSSMVYSAIVKLNNKFIRIMTEKVFHGNYSGNATDDIFSTLESIRILNKFTSLRQFSGNIKLLRVLQNMIDIYHENQNTRSKFNKKNVIYQKMYAVYNCMSLSFLNSYSILFNSYVFLKNNNTDYYKRKIDKMKIEMREKLENITIGSQKIMKNTAEIIRQSDPKEYKQGENYVQLKRFLHVHVIAKQVLKNRDACGFDKCSDTLRVTLPNDSPHKLQCNGNLHDCWTTSVRQYCLSENNTDKRAYEAFKNNDSVTCGPWNKDICKGKNVFDLTSLVKDKKHVWGKSFINFSVKYEVDCEVCACYCDDFRNTESIRTFSLQQVRSKYEQGIVTGVKMQIVNGIVVLKIRVGLLVNGIVDVDEQSWGSSHVLTLNPNGSPVNGTKNNNTNVNPTEELKYSTVQLNYNYRNVLLDQINAPEGSVIQGVKFVTCQDGLSISVLATKINEKRKLIPETAKWYSHCHKNFTERTKIEIPANPEAPINSKLQNFVRSTGNSYVQFQTTDWETDGSQTTVPFLDTQRVVVDPPLPVSGVGIYYKTHEKSGGFIALQLLTFDHSFFMSKEIINKDLDKYE